MSDSNIIGHLPKRKNLAAILFCAAGVALNLILNTLAAVFDLPLYLDTVGTIVVSAAGGYLPGVAVGFATNVFESLKNPDAMYYGVLNVLIALIAARLARRGRFRSVSGIIEAICLFALVGGGLGFVISGLGVGYSYDSEFLSGIAGRSGQFGLVVSHFLSNLISDLPDKAVCAILAVCILHVIPENGYSWFSFSYWMQKPLSPDEMKPDDADKASIRVVSLRTKALLVIGLSLTAVAIMGMVISMKVHSRAIIGERTTLARGIAKTAAARLDGDRIDDYLEKGEDAEGYLSDRNALEEILTDFENVSYLYVYRFMEDGCHVVFDIDTETAAGEKAGTVVDYNGEVYEEYIPALIRGEEVDPVATNDKYGRLMTAFQPVYASDGRCVSYVCADVDLEQLAVDEQTYLVKMLSIFLSSFILLCTFIMWLVEYSVIYPVRSLTKNALEISRAGDTSSSEESQEELERDVRALRSINIHTGDELESLYYALCQMTVSQTEQMRSILRLSDSTAKMQDGLIITMADMVENRDSDTGAHIQKTAAYVRIIIEGLKKRGYYTEKLTPKFISEAVRSAPLHDVGKINVPDEVLNKPGKLTSEEFEIMKTHTTAGKRIMEHAISTVEGDNYLKEARNMAAYHHERWDGKGYPERLHGEVIPLSARIMAVADVFDALTSPRVYKPAFSLEKALSIIEEGKGTQFDPKCVEVFMDSLDEVKVVLRKYNHTEV